MCVCVCVYRLPNATEVAAASLVQAVEEKFEMTRELNAKLIQIKCSDTQRRTEVSSGCVWGGGHAATDRGRQWLCVGGRTRSDGQR